MTLTNDGVGEIVLESEQVTEALTEYAGKLLNAPIGSEYTAKVVIFPDNRTAKVIFTPKKEDK